jgi:NitT/TauT family transport system ATP-binding protein
VSAVPAPPPAPVPPPPAAAPAVELAGIEMTFNPGQPNAVQALAAIDLSIRPGEFVSLIGPSGCGKSTLLRLIADLLRPTAGAVTVNGKPARQARLDHDYGMAFQHAGLFEWRTVVRNVELPLELRGWPKAKRSATGRGSCRAACSSGWPSPAPSPPAPGCS